MWYVLVFTLTCANPNYPCPLGYFHFNWPERLSRSECEAIKHEISREEEVGPSDGIREQAWCKRQSP